MHRRTRARSVAFAALAAVRLLSAAEGVHAAGNVQGDSPTFFYDGQRRQPVVVSETEFLVKVRAANNTPAAVRPDSLGPVRRPRLANSRRDLQAHIEMAESKLARTGLHVVRDTADRAALAAAADVAWAFPMLRRPGSDVPIYLTDEIVVRLKPGLSTEAANRILAAAGCVRTRGIGNQPDLHVVRVRVPAETDPLTVANSLHEMRQVRYAHPNFILLQQTCELPQVEDPMYVQQWYLDHDVERGAAAGADINVEVAWDTDNGPFSHGNPSIRVAIMDDSVNWAHPDLAANYVTGRDFDPEPGYDDDPSPDWPFDYHGTPCAGLAVAADNTVGIRGVAPACGLIGIKFFAARSDGIAAAFYFAMDPNGDGDHSDGAAVLSNSWSYLDGLEQPPVVVEAIETVATQGRNGKGSLVLFSAGNNDHTVDGISAIAQLDTVMCIGASNSFAQHAEYSSVGPEVSVVAPSSDSGDDGIRQPALGMTTTDNVGDWGLDVSDYTTDFGGTSAATPIVSGVCALVLSQDSTLTAADVRSIVEHTAVQIDPDDAQIHGITQHSHRFGYGRVDAGAAMTAAQTSTTWPRPVAGLACDVVNGDLVLSWENPSAAYAATLVVQSITPFAWHPMDGHAYVAGQTVAPGVTVIQNVAAESCVIATAPAGAYFLGVFPRSNVNRYGWGRACHAFVDTLDLFYDDSEGEDPGWTHGGAQDAWARGIPTAYALGQLTTGSGPLPGTDGLEAIHGRMCWGTGLDRQYWAGTEAYLRSPIIDLRGVTSAICLTFYDWCLLDTPYDQCRLKLVDETGAEIVTLADDLGGDHDWLFHAYDITPYANQRVHVQFELSSDEAFERDGWFIDEVRVTAAASGNFGPSARPVSVETPAGTAVLVTLDGFDPNPSDLLTYRIDSLPAFGTLADPAAGPITQVPYALTAYGAVVEYTPTTGYLGADTFAYHVTDGQLDSAMVSVSLSVGLRSVMYAYPLDSDPGWIREGGWAFGPPLGLGDRDPASALTGTNIFGYNLAGNYPGDLATTEYLVAGPMDCRALTRVQLKYQRWLCVESHMYDHASIDVSQDGQVWHSVWTNGPGLHRDTEWVEHALDLSAFADGEQTVYMRWGLGPTNGQGNYGGWNLDDVELLAVDVGNLPPEVAGFSVIVGMDRAEMFTLPVTDPNPHDVTNVIIVSLPLHGVLSDPAVGPIMAVPYALSGHAAVVEYMPAAGFNGQDSVSFKATDAMAESEIAAVSLDVIDAVMFPFEETFENGPPLGTVWRVETGGCGRVAVVTEHEPDGQYQVRLDASDDTGTCPSYSALTIAVSLASQQGVYLSFDFKRFGDDIDPLPDSWQGSTDGDGVAFSVNGDTWYAFDPLTYDGVGTPPPFEHRTIDLDAALAARGVAYSDTVRIRFQQTGTHSAPNGGLAVDNIRLYGAGPIASDVRVEVQRGRALSIPLAASDPNPDDVLSFVITNLPEHGILVDTMGSAISAVPHVITCNASNVGYSTNDDFSGIIQFTYYATDGVFDSNEAIVTIVVYAPVSVPFFDHFNSGPPLGIWWRVHSTSAGRIEVTDQYGPIGTHHVVLDSREPGVASTNELTLLVNLEAQSNISLLYSWKSFNDEFTRLPSVFMESAVGDGIAVSYDGLYWHRIADFAPTNPTIPAAAVASSPETPAPTDSVYQMGMIDLDAAVAALGMGYTDEFRIRFQQSDDHPVPYDGIAVDNVQIRQLVPGPTIVTTSLPIGTTRIGYGPSALQAANGEPPLAWSVAVDSPSALPAGLTLSTQGVISGTPSEVGVFTVDFMVTDAFSRTDVRRLPIEVQPGRAAADFDADRDVDIQDFGTFQVCFNGPNRPRSQWCEVADLDLDNDVDLSDFAVFQRCFNGTNRPPQPTCPLRP